MLAAVVSVRNCCHGLRSRSAVERRRCANELKTLLTDDAICRALADDVNDELDGPAGEQSDWCFVLDESLAFFHVQLTKLDDDVNGGKDAAGCQRHMQEAAALLQSVVRGACRHSRATISVTHLTGRLLEWLRPRRPQRQLLVTNELVQLLRLTCLTEPALSNALDGACWLQLVDTLAQLTAASCSSVAHERPPRLGTEALLPLLSQAVQLGHRQCALIPALRRLLQLLQLPADNRCTMSPAWLQLAAEVLRPLCQETPELVSGLAASLVHNALAHCDKKSTGHILPLLTILYDCLETLHDDPDTPVDADKWSSLLRRVFNHLTTYCESFYRHNTLRSKTVSGPPSGLVGVWSRTLLLLLPQFVSPAQVSMVGDDDGGDGDGGCDLQCSVAKRRRVVSDDIELVLARAFTDHMQLDSLPWLQLLRRLVLARRQLLDHTERALCRRRLVASLRTCQLPQLVMALCRLAVAVLVTGWGSEEAAFGGDLWHAALKHATVAVCGRQCHMLLQCLARCWCVLAAPTATVEVWRLYNRALLTPQRWSVASLAALLQSSGTTLGCDSGSAAVARRAELIDWLLPDQNTTTSSSSSDTGVSLCNCAHTGWALLRLMLREASATLTEQPVAAAEVVVVDRETDASASRHVTGETAASLADSCIPTLKRTILLRLAGALKFADFNASLERCCVNALAVTHAISVWTDVGVVSSQNPDFCALLTELDSLMNCMLDYVCDRLCGRRHCKAVYQVLSTVEDLLTIQLSDKVRQFGRCIHVDAILCRRLTTSFLSKLVDFVLSSSDDSVTGQECVDSSNTHHPQSQSQGMSVLHSFADADSDTEADRTLSAGNIVESPSPPSSPQSHSVTGALRLWPVGSSASTLSLTDQLRLRATSLLLSALKFIPTDRFCCGGSGSSGSVSHLITALCSHSYNLSNCVDSRVALALVCTLPSAAEFRANIDHLLAGYVRLLKLTCGRCFVNGATAAAATGQLSDVLVPLVAPTDNSNSSSNTRLSESIMTVYSGLVTLAKRGRGGHQFLVQLLHMTAAVCRHDPAGGRTTVRGEWAGQLLLNHFACADTPPAAANSLWSSHESRMTAAHLVAELIVSREQLLLPTELPYPGEMVQTAVQSLTASVSACGGDSDQLRCRAVEFITCMSAICRVSVQCRSLGLFALLANVELYGPAHGRFAAAIGSLCRRWQIGSPRELLRVYPSVCGLWLAAGRGVCELPWRLLHHASEAQFLRGTLPLFLPHMLAESGGATEAARLALAAGWPSARQLVLEAVPWLLATAAVECCSKSRVACDGGATGGAPVWQHAAVQAALSLLQDQQQQQLMRGRTVDTVLLCCRAVRVGRPPLAQVLHQLSDEPAAASLQLLLQQDGSDGVQRLLCQLAADVDTGTALSCADRSAALGVFTQLVQLLMSQLAQLLDGAPFYVRFVNSFVSRQLLRPQRTDGAADTLDLVQCLLTTVHACDQHAPHCLAASLSPVTSALRHISKVSPAPSCADQAREAWHQVTSVYRRHCAQLFRRLEVIELRDGEQLQRELKAATVAVAVAGADNDTAASAVVSHFLAGATVAGRPSSHCLRCLGSEASRCQLSSHTRHQLFTRLCQCVSTDSGGGGRAASPLLLQVGRVLAAIGPLPDECADVHQQNHHDDHQQQQQPECSDAESVEWRLLTLLHAALWHERIAVTQAAATALCALLATGSGRKTYKAAAAAAAAGQCSDMCGQLRPFLAPGQTSLTPSAGGATTGVQTPSLDSARLWTPDDGAGVASTGGGVTFDSWLRAVLLALLGQLDDAAEESALWRACRQLFCVADGRLTVHFLPQLVQLVLERRPQLRPVLGRCFSRVFVGHERACDNLPESSASAQLGSGEGGGGGVCRDTDVLRALLAVVRHLRTRPLPPALRQLMEGAPADSAWQRHFWLPLQLRAAARAALTVGAVHDCLLMAELWCLQQQEEEQQQRTCGNDEQLQLLLLEAYNQLGDDGAASAVQSGAQSTTPVALRQLERRDALTALVYYDGCEQQWAQAGVSRCLRQLQLFGQLHQQRFNYSSSSSAAAAADWQPLNDCWYEAAWRLGRWQLAPTETAQSPLHSAAASSAAADLQCTSVNVALFNALRAYRDGNTYSAVHALNTAVTRGVLAVCRLAPPPTQLNSVNRQLSQLQILLAASDLLAACNSCEQTAALCRQFGSGGSGGDSFSSNQLPYEQRETLVLARAGMLQLAAARFPSVAALCVETRHRLLEQLCSEALAAGALASAHRVAQQLPEQLVAGRLCRARVWWACGEHTMAIKLHSQLLSELQATDGAGRAGGGEALENRLLRLRLQVEFARWTAETHAVSSRDLIDRHFQPASQLMQQLVSEIGDRSDIADQMADAHHAIGRYLDAQFERVEQFLSSAECRRREQAVCAMLDEAEQLQQLPQRTTPLTRKLSHLEQVAHRHRHQLQQQRADRAEYLRMTLDSYLRCLHLSVRHDILIFRVTALWLSERQLQVTQLLEQAGSQQLQQQLAVPEHKWLPVLRQLAARLGKPDTEPRFRRQLHAVLLACARQHPHHALPVLMALAQARQDAKPAGRGVCVKDEVGAARSECAEQLLGELCAHSPTLCEHIGQMRALHSALIALANLKTPPRTKSLRLPASTGVERAARNAWRVGVATVAPPLAIDGNYTGSPPVCVVGYDGQVCVMGGRSAPKKVTCLCSDGVRRVQLVKGEDDLRQDAVMQQVFGVVNQLLAKEMRCNAATTATTGQLTIRTYQVVPLTQRCGVIEWCTNTIPLSEFLYYAHPFYHPDDLPVKEAYNSMMQVVSLDVNERRRVFLAICARLRPVLRHFFFEKFAASAVQWYRARCRYTDTVATASMAGYVMGLGDRHVNNLLLDQTTAQLVLIDFGIAFDTGLLLPTPETVPFRLTRDVIDGMGAAGVEGRFAAGCRSTLHVLRRHSDIILTLARVLLDDPLYEWALTDTKVRRRQLDTSGGAAGGGGGAAAAKVRSSNNNNSGSSSGAVSDSCERHNNRLAESVLVRLAEKLRGLEMGQMMSCQAQVNYLIQQARDTDNLCRLYYGWQPYL